MLYARKKNCRIADSRASQLVVEWTKGILGALELRDMLSVDSMILGRQNEKMRIKKSYALKSKVKETAQIACEKWRADTQQELCSQKSLL